MPLYPNKNIASREALYGRQHLTIYTDDYIESLADKPIEIEVGVATEFYLDRPSVPLYQPRMPAKENCKAT